jgi:hypothetical protein
MIDAFATPFLIRWYATIIVAELLAFLGVLFSCRNWILPMFRSVSKSVWGALAVIVLCGGALRMNGLHLYATYFDGYEYTVATQAIAKSGTFHACTSKVDDTCFSQWLPTHPPASNVLYALFMRLRGGGADDFFDASALVGAASIALFFVAAFAVFGDSRKALWAALLLAFTPIHLKLSSAGMLEIGEIFYALLLLFSLSLLKERPQAKTLLLVALATLLVAQSRAEAILFCVLVVGTFAVFHRGLKSRWAASSRPDARFVAVAALLGVLFLVDVYYVRFVTTTYSGPFGVQRNINGFTWAYLTENIRPDIRFYFDNYFHPLFYSVAAIAGLILSFGSPLSMDTAFLAVWFLGFTGLFLCYGPTFGNFGHSESQHFSLIATPPLLMAAAAGIEKIAGFAKKGGGGLRVLFAVLIVSNAYFFGKRYIHTTAPAEPRFTDELFFVRSLRDRLPADSFIVTVNPNLIFANTVFSGTEMRTFDADIELLSQLAPKSRNMSFYFLEDTWCPTLAESGDHACETFKRSHKLELLERAENGSDALYRLILPTR